MPRRLVDVSKRDTGDVQMALRLTIATPMLDIGTEWTLSDDCRIRVH